jgi:DNA-binding MarR family transcriptional regulator
MNEEKPLGLEIRFTSNLIKSYVDQELEKKLSYKLTGIEGMTMGYIFRHDKEEITAAAVMEKSHASKATTSQTLAGLVKKGYIKMIPSPSDKRKKIISLTKEGQEVEAEFKEAFVEIGKEVKKGLSEEDEKKIREILKKVQQNVAGLTRE